MTTSSSVYWPPSPEPFPPLDHQQQQQQHQGYQQQSRQHSNAQGFAYGALPNSQSQHHHQQQTLPQQNHPQLQLEHHIDALTSFAPAFNASAYGAAAPAGLPQIPPSQPAAAVIGVGQGPHNEPQKYTARTATALAAGAGAAPAGAFVFGQQTSPRGESGVALSSTTSPEEAFGGFQFQPGASSGRAREGVAPHERLPQQQTLQSPPITLSHSQSQNTGYLLPSGYTPQHAPYAAPAQKRRRGEEDASGWSGSGAGSGGDGEDDEHDHEQDYDDGAYDGANDFSGDLGQYGIGARGGGAGFAQGFAGGLPSQYPFDASAASYGGAQQQQLQAGMAGMGPGQAPGMVGPDGRPKQAHRAACVRCKNLKVRCEFPQNAHLLGDAAVCRRCSNGNHKCEIPGRKKRRQPPKREHLLNQIREQAEEISRLMGLLESYRRKAMRDEPTRLSLSNTPLPASVAASAAPGSAIAAAAARQSVSNGTREPPPEVKAWIEQARQTFEAIGGLIEEGAFTAASDADADNDLEGDLESGDGSFEASDAEPDQGAESDAAPWLGSQPDSSYVASPPPTSSASDAGASMSSPSSPAMTVRSASREGSAAPTLASNSSGSQRIRRTTSANVGTAKSARRKTPQPTLPTTSAAPFGMFAALASAVEQQHQGSRSPRSSRGKSVETEIGASEEASRDGTSPTQRDEKMDATRNAGVDGDGDGEAEVHVTVEAERSEDGQETVKIKRESESEGLAYGPSAVGFFGSRRRTASSGAHGADRGVDSDNAARGQDGDESKANVGSGSEPARPLAPPGSTAVPHILARGVVGPKEVEELFDIYFDKMNLSCSLLDPVLYTAKATYWRSPFLFTVLCAIASRYYPSARPGLYEELMTYAQLAAGTALISGPKTVETVAAYILLSLYPLPKARWEDDRTWLYLGLAIRVATDLNLHTTALTPPGGGQKPESERHARERLNRVRVWLNCYNLDRSTASWHGKASTIAGRDFIAAHSELWCTSSQYNLPGFDIQLVAYNAELRRLGEFKESIYGDPENPTGLSKDKDISKLASDFDERLLRQEAEWNERLARETNHANDSQARFRNSLVKLAYRYARLTVLSFGFHQAFRPTPGSAASSGDGKEEDRKPFFDRCHRAATEIARVFIDELSSQKIYLRHGPDAQCVFVTFASAFLIKLLHPKYATYLTLDQRREIHSLVRGIVELLSSPEVAIDEKHSPRLWSRFLEGLLATPMARVELPQPNATAGSPGSKRRQSQKNAQSQVQKQTKSQSREEAQSQETSPSSVSQDFQSTPRSNVDALASPPIYGQSQALSHPQSQPQQTSFDMHAQSNQADMYGTGASVPSYGPYGAQQQHAQQGTMPTYNAGGLAHGNVTQTGTDVNMYGLTSPLSSPLTGDLTSPTLGPSTSMTSNPDHLHTAGNPSDGTGATIAPNALHMHVPDFYQPPVPVFDSDLLASMQAMQDPSVWQDMPGYNWMSTLQTADTDSAMQDANAFLAPGSASASSGGMGYNIDSHFATSTGPLF